MGCRVVGTALQLFFVFLPPKDKRMNNQQFFHYCSTVFESESGLFKVDASGIMLSFEPAEDNQPFEEVSRIHNNYHFETSTSIRSFVVPEGVKGFGIHVMGGIRVVERFELPASLIEIPQGFFADSILPTVKLPDGLLKIDDFAFGHSFIEELYIPEALESPYGRQFKDSYVGTLYLPNAWEGRARLTDYGSLDIKMSSFGERSYLFWPSTMIGALRFYKHHTMYNREFTSERINELKPNEIFVFGSNLAGMHGGGAARVAVEEFGAIWGQGVGLQGQSYAIPTMHGGVDAIQPYVDEFIEFAFIHYEYKFLVTPIGCGIAGFIAEEIAPLFEDAIDLPNVILPKSFVEVIQHKPSVVVNHEITWDSEKDFLVIYRSLMEQVEFGDSDAYYKVKELRAKEFRNTIEIVNQGGYVTETGETYAFPDDAEMMRKTEFYEQEIQLPEIVHNYRQTIVDVQNIDCLYAGARLKEQGYNPAVLNMASRRNPGGGVSTGAGAQEETLFRRTNLFRSLYQFAPYAEQYGVKPSHHQYPLDRNFGGVYTPDAIYFRESEQKGYALLEEPVNLSFITVAGMNRPDLTDDGYIADHHVEPIKNKIRTIFRMGLAHGHDSLVLGALGCGAFRNPPRHVARLFHEVMEESEFKNKYRRIVFAILDDHNAHQRHNPEGNFRPFVEEFGC